MAGLRFVALCAAATIAASQNCPEGTYNGGHVRVHVSPHSHDDVGWDETYMQYFLGTGPIRGSNVTQIISQVVASLLSDPRRKFSYVEQAFFQIWFETQTPALQAQVKGLVTSGQLTFINGGWSMHDEANPTYIDMLDNTAIGQRYIAMNFGVPALPTITWQIDPFGHSAFQGVMGGSMSGYKGVMWAREPGELKLQSCDAQAIERVWFPSPSLGNASALFQGVFNDAGYGAPGECGRCSDQAPGSPNCNYSWGAKDVDSLISDIFAFRAPYQRLNANGDVDILLNFGDDFQWENAKDYHDYTQGLIDALNADSQGRFTAFFSTPAQYMAAKIGNVTKLPTITSDFMPYNDDSQGHNLWTGYMTSRPAFKGFVRDSSSLFTSARQLQTLVGGPVDLGPSNLLFKLERAMGVSQHHDSVAGTAKENVNKDYSMRLEDGRQDAFASLAASFASATGYTAAGFKVCALNNVTLCPSLESGAATVVLAYNNLGQAAPTAPIRLSAGFPSGVASYAVYDHTGAPVTAQVVPPSARDTALRALYQGNAAVPVQWLCFQGSLPAAGYSAFFLVPAAKKADAPHTHDSTLVTTTEGDSTVTNGRVTLTISAATGLLSGYADATTGVSIPLTQEWMSYIGFNGKSTLNGSRQASGAYIFRPLVQTPEPITTGAASVITVSGPVVNEAQHTYGYVTQSTRLWAGSAQVEVEWTVGPVDVSDGQSHEVITRYSTGLATNKQWVTDSNCREGQLRTRNFRPSWPVTISEPVSSNYYPTNCLVRTSSPAVTFAVAVDRSEGSSSLVDGQIEIMVHRRLLFDDGRGVGEPLNEPGLDGKGLIIRGHHWLIAAPAASAPAAYKALQQTSVMLPTSLKAIAPLGSVTPAQWIAAYNGTASLLSAPLPPNIHLATVHSYSPKTLLLRLAHLYDINEDAAGSAPATVSLATLLAAPMKIVSAVEMTMPGSQPLAGVAQTTFHLEDGSSVTVPVLPMPPSGATLDVTLTVQQIRTFMCTLA